MNPVCPACAIATRLIRWRDLDGFECPECRGHFVRAKHLERFLEKHGPDNFASLLTFARNSAPSPRALTCPGCGTRSFRAVRRGILEIDVCASCSSVYFDEGESITYLRQARVKRFGQSVADDLVSTDADWNDLIESFFDNFLD